MTAVSAALSVLLLLLLHGGEAASLCGRPSLSGSQKRALRSHAGRLAASKTLHYVNIGSVERSASEVDQQLTAVELLRCKFAVTKKSEAKEMANELAEATGSTVAEVLGHTALLYRPSEKRLFNIDG